ncbi:hypothetical protein M5689_006930 [Euphorbia peplus]|nr:hypothetical protein M5689_006930 [Euphorbia peplus]
MTLFDEYLKTWVTSPYGNNLHHIENVTTGDFAQAFAHPSFRLTKEYIATVDGSVSKRHLIAISDGTVVEGVHCTPDSVELLPRQAEVSRARLRFARFGKS